jgi:hypothetical protein
MKPQRRGTGCCLRAAAQAVATLALVFLAAHAPLASAQPSSGRDTARPRQPETVPVNATVSKVTKVGDRLVSFGGGVRYWAEGPDAAPSGSGARLFVTLLFPK